MKRKFFYLINALLGLLSLGLVGCRSQRPPEVMYGAPAPKKYGPPASEVVRELEPEPQPQPEPQPAPVERPEPIPCKYGVPVERELK